MTRSYDVAIVGAGILGLAHAFHFARAGQRVLLLERHSRAQGASIRNFGMIWPIGQPAGPLYRVACRSRELWLEVLQSAGLWHACCGSLHLAYHDDEAQVLHEFLASSSTHDRPGDWLTPDQIAQRFPAVHQQHLRGGLQSPLEMTVDPREVLRQLPRWLACTHGVQFEYDTTVLGFALPHVHTFRGDFKAQRLVLCTGTDFRDLLPAAFAESGLTSCKLQMMRTPPLHSGFHLKAMLAAGLTLQHYRSFADCPTLPELKRRLERQMPDYLRFGIHVMAAQNGQGEIVIGDSHEYGDAIEPFDNPAIDDLILEYLRTFVDIPGLTIAARWHGLYVKHPIDPFVVLQPERDVLAVTGVGGAGMTLSFGLAEQTTAFFLGE